MTTLTITLPDVSSQKAKERAKSEGFKNPNEWARFLVEQNLALAESPKIASSAIIAEMQKTSLYKASFLKELKKSLMYADKTY